MINGSRKSSSDKTTPSDYDKPVGFHVQTSGALNGQIMLTHDPADHDLSDFTNAFVLKMNFAPSALKVASLFEPAHGHGSGSFGHSHPQGVWSDGTIIYVSDRSGGTITDHSGAAVFAYGLDGTKHVNKHFRGMGNDGMKHITGIWSDGVTMWMADSDVDKVFAYKMSDRKRDKSREFDLDSDNGDARGLWSDGIHMWVVDPEDDKVYAYHISGLTAIAGPVSAQTECGKGNHDPGQEFSLDSANADPWGIWSDGETVWIGDPEDKRLYAYNLINGSRKSSSDKTIPSDYDKPVGFHVQTSGALNGQIMLTHDPADHDLSDFTNAFVLKMNFAPSALKVASLFEPAHGHGSGSFGHSHPQGVWSDGTIIYVSDRSGGTITDHSGAAVFAYGLDGTKHVNKHFRGMGNDGMKHITGIWSDGVTMWMADSDVDKVFAYKMSDRKRDKSREFDLDSDNGDARGLWSDGIHMWVVDPEDDKVYVYDISRLTATKNELAPDTTTTLGLWSDADRIFVGDPGSDKVRAYHGRNHYHQPRYDVDLDTDQGNTNAGGIWYNPATKILYVANSDATKRVFAYELGSGTPTWNSNYDIPALADVGMPNGIWSDGETMWIVDATNYNVAAYELPTLTRTGVRRRLDRDIKLPDSMESPHGAHSDGNILWVLDDTELDTDDRLYAFRLSNGEREPTKDVRLGSANSTPRGVSSRDGDNEKLMVVDAEDDKAFHYYSVPEVPVISMELSLVELSEDGGTHSMIAEITVEEMFGGALSYDLTVDVLVSPVTATIDAQDGDYRAFPTDSSGPTKLVGQANIPAGSTQSTVRFSIEVFDDDITEGTEHLLVFAEDSRSVTGNARGSINKHEASVLVPILDNDVGPCSPVTISKLSQRDEAISADPSHELSGVASTGEGEHHGELSDLCVSSPHIRWNTYMKAYKFTIPVAEGADVQDERRVRLVVQSDLNANICSLSGKCREEFDPNLLLLRGGELENATIIGDYSDIDMRTGNLSAGALVDLYPGDYIAYVTSHSHWETGGYTFIYHLENPGGPALTLPARRDNVLWYPDLASTPFVYDPAEFRTHAPPTFVVYAPRVGESAAKNRLDRGNHLITRAGLSVFSVGNGSISYLAGPPEDAAKLPRWYRIDGESHNGRTWGGLRWLEVALTSQAEPKRAGGESKPPSQQSNLGVQGSSDPMLSVASFVIYHDPGAGDAAANRYNRAKTLLSDAGLAYSEVTDATQAQVDRLAGVTGSVMPRFFLGDPTEDGWTSEPGVNNGGLRWLEARVAELDDDAEDDPPANTPATGIPTIGGTAQVGQTLTADTSGISDADGLTSASFAYQWLADGSDISGATGASYTPVAGDVGRAVSVLISFTDDAGNAEQLTSAATAAVVAADPPADEASGPAALEGLTVNPVAGKTTELAVSWTAFTGADKYLVQWKTGSAEFNSGEETTSASYPVTGLDAGTAYSVRVSAIDTDADPDATLATGEASGATLAAMGTVTVAAVTDSSDRLDVSWPAVSGAVGYRVEYKTGSNPYTTVARSDATATTERVTGLDTETAYTVRVTARHTIAGAAADGDSSEGSGTTNPAAEAPAVSFVIYHDPDAGDDSVDRYNEARKLLSDAGFTYTEVKDATQADVDRLAGVAGSVMPRFFLGDPTDAGWTPEPGANNGGLRWLKKKVAELSED